MSATALAALIPLAPAVSEVTSRPMQTSQSRRDDAGERSFAATLNRTTDRQTNEDAPAASARVKDEAATTTPPADTPTTATLKKDDSQPITSKPVSPHDPGSIDAQVAASQAAAVTALILPLVSEAAPHAADSLQILTNNVLTTTPQQASLALQLAALPSASGGANVTRTDNATAALAQTVAPLMVEATISTTPAETATAGAGAAANADLGNLGNISTATITPTASALSTSEPAMITDAAIPVQAGVKAVSTPADSLLPQAPLPASETSVTPSVAAAQALPAVATGPAIKTLKPTATVSTPTLDTGEISEVDSLAPTDVMPLVPVMTKTDAPVPGSSTNVTQATPTATTSTLQATAMKLSEGKKTDDKTNLETKVTAGTERPFSEMMTQGQTGNQTMTRTAGIESTTLAAPAVPTNAMEKAVTQQVTRALVQHLPSGDKVLVLRLTPPELGTVRIELMERQGVLSARLHAEDDGVRLALEKSLPMMRQELRASDAPIREVSVSDQSLFDRSFSDGRGQQFQDQAARNRLKNNDEPTFSIDGVTIPRERPLAATALGGRADRSGVDAFA